MDEPCSALDPVATAKIEDLITRLARDVTIVLVTHNMFQATRVVEIGPTATAFDSPVDSRTKECVTGHVG